MDLAAILRDCRYVRNRLAILLGAALALVVLVTYVGMIRNDVVWDDPWLTTKNPYVQSLHGIPTLFAKDTWTVTAVGEASDLYRPMMMVSFLANRLLFGNTPASYHIGNLLLHLGASLLFFRLLYVLLGDGRPWLPWIVALFFAVAPLGSEPVAWISGRDNSLGAVFALAALLANRHATWRMQMATLAMVALALLTKESFVALPILLVAQDTLVLGRPLEREWRKALALLVILALFFVVRLAVGVPSASLVAGKITPILASFLYLAATYAVRAVVPRDLEAFRPYAPLAAPLSIAVGLAIAGASAILFVACRRDPAARRPRMAAFGWIWFVAALAPASLTGPYLGLVGDRYAYFPLMGLCVVVAAGLDALRVRTAHWPASVPAGVFCVLLAGIAACARTSRQRVGEWRDEDTLFHATLAREPDNFYALYWLGARAAQDGHWEQARDLLDRSLAVEPRSYRTHDALCFLDLNVGRLREAEAECSESLSLHAGNPRAWVNLASTYLRARAWPACIDAATRAVDVKPHYAEAHYLRAVCLANAGHIPEAIDENRAALGIDPTHSGALSLASQMRARALVP
jgi:hypothetical protein